MDKNRKNDWQAFRDQDEVKDLPYPKVSIIMPIYNCSQLVTVSFESLLIQDFPDFEIIVIDAGSTDRSLEIVKCFYDPRIRICSVAAYNRYEMLNKGISLAKGSYINFLFPGDYYIHRNTLRQIMGMAIEYDFPHLLYGASLLRGDGKDVRILYRQLKPEVLKIGEQPTSLQSCWFHVETFRVIGKFSIDFENRGSYDLLCRFCLYSNLRFVSIKHVLSDYTSRSSSRRSILIHFKETFKVIKTYFGFVDAFKWLFIQKDISRFAKLWTRALKTAFLGYQKPL